MKNASGTTILTASGHFIGGCQTFKVGSYGAFTPTSERDREVAVDISGLATTAWNHMRSNGFSIGVRWHWTDYGHDGVGIILDGCNRFRVSSYEGSFARPSP